jgi:hypothetical protein
MSMPDATSAEAMVDGGAPESWAAVRERLERATPTYWLATVGPDGDRT